MVAFSLENLADNVHDLWTESWTSHENTLNDRGSKSLELGVAVLNEICSWFSKLVKLRSDQILQHIYGWETWNGVTLMHGNCALNGHI